jgi:hypothetical protein
MPTSATVICGLTASSGEIERMSMPAPVGGVDGAPP